MVKVMKSAEKKLNLTLLLESFTFLDFWVLAHRPSLTPYEVMDHAC